MSQSILNILKEVNGASFISIDTLTKPVLLGGRKNPMQGRITKMMAGASVMVFQNKRVNGYEAMVHRRLIQEGKDPVSFELGPRAWGERVEHMPVVEHKGKLYLEVIFLTPGTVQYFLDGVPIEREAIEGLNDDKPEGEQGGLKNKVIIRTFAFENLVSMTINGRVHIFDNRLNLV